MFDQTLGLFDDHFGDLDVTRGRLIEGRRDDLTVHRTLHVGDFFGPLVDQQDDQIDFRMVRRDCGCNRLQHHRFAGTRRRHDQAALALAERGNQIDDARCHILIGRIVTAEHQLFFRIERRQVVEIDPVTDIVRLVEINQPDLEQCKIPLAVFRRANLALDGVARAQRKAPDLAGRHVDVIRARQVVRLG